MPKEDTPRPDTGATLTAAKAGELAARLLTSEEHIALGVYVQRTEANLGLAAPAVLAVALAVDLDIDDDRAADLIRLYAVGPMMNRAEVIALAATLTDEQLGLWMAYPDGQEVSVDAMGFEDYLSDTWRAAFRHRVATDPAAAAKCVSWHGPPPTAEARRDLSAKMLDVLREHMATMPPAPEPDPDPEVNAARFDEGCEFDDWAEDQLAKEGSP